MKALAITILTFLGLLLPMSALTEVMSIQVVEDEWSQTAPGMPTASSESLLNSNSPPLKFPVDALQGVNGLGLSTGPASPLHLTGAHLAPDSPPQQDAHLMDTDLELSPTWNPRTIIQSSQALATPAEAISERYRKMISAAGSTLQNDGNNQEDSQQTLTQNPLLDLLITVIIEAAITLIVLHIAFQISGFPRLARQIIPLSLALALVGALLDTVLQMGLFNPIRIGLSFIILPMLIRVMTDVREWATAIKIGLTARLISIGIMWLAFTAMMVLLEL